MRLAWWAVAIAAAMSTAVPARAGGEWPDGPNKAWFENLQRPDNHLAPYRNIDPKSLFCCGIADTVKTKFRVEAGDSKHPEDRWYAWLKDQWVLVPPERLSPTLCPMVSPIFSCSPGPFSASSGPRVAFSVMESDSDVVAAQERRPTHWITASRDAVAIVVLCTCGWSHEIRRCEDPRAHAAKVRSAWTEHAREIAAGRTT